MKDTLNNTMIEKESMWIRTCGFVRMVTSGLAYPIVIHSVLMTAFALLLLQVLRTYGFDPDKLLNVLIGLFAFLFFSLLELHIRRYEAWPLLEEDIPLVQILAYIMFVLSTISLNYLDFAFLFVEILFGCWFFFVWYLFTFEQPVQKSVSL
ncbi:hypothetical protein ISN44_As08g030440 [Arabidopsis suecica]|uniref:Uncharacterized protein n=1 Tax=Arabidopsis suecica TaxID=45249 RepID=A0A8T2B9U9_ARASU|nr:hypothetical protein ISN44_As08g030440 [Arabidopsis suecica]